MTYDDPEGYLDAVASGAAEYYEGQGITVYDYSVTKGGICPAACGMDSGLVV